MLLNFTKDELEQLGAIHTATEIAQQPTVWKKVMELIRDQQNEIEEFLKFLNNNYSNVRVILTGAGTSAYIGETVLRVVLRGKRTALDFTYQCCFSYKVSLPVLISL